jgi:hypothetical protein
MEEEEKFIYNVYDDDNNFFGLVETTLNKIYFEYWLYYWMKICRCLRLYKKLGNNILSESEKTFMSGLSNDLRDEIDSKVWEIDGFINFIKRKTPHAIKLKEPIHISFNNRPDYSDIGPAANE